MGPDYYEAQSDAYKEFISGNDLLTIPADSGLGPVIFSPVTFHAIVN